ncbi:Hypothetical protein SAM23877_4342 [Streptomyces ambofaciens ATCC 23877]|uniref:Uncharacterized protein n=1 Tax=Streptomyces ambofaciens (strain ATCC 23877 / 3486 / DSM 40053 / JCM 4204 / NBRC 12836 / NRRL B-2516) TaxID=278992 RepID=A0A0K2AX29_STRA7|nr:hypothetical protein [Streptomyces ambofaciens]AKZ57387.1 Hypothetical protein SAM23877_4342 [Streptomyces ambofaciens ATCC 23877]
MLTLASCGSSSDSGGAGGRTTVARDKGPACVGTAPANGVHVLRGGGFALPGGGGVQYADGSADGTTRTATLRDGLKYAPEQRQWKASPGTDIEVGGHEYTVRQICSYRVALEPKLAADRTALAAAPTSLEPRQGSADTGLCFTTNRAVVAIAAKGFPPRGDTFSLLDNGGVQRFPTGLSLTVSYVDTNAGTAGIAANCAAVPVAGYKDVRVGDTVELAGVLFEVSGLTDEAVELTRTSA